MSEQEELFATEWGGQAGWIKLTARSFTDEHTYVRRNARDTSRAAAVSVLPRTGTKRAMVLEAIRYADDEGRTDEELQNQLGMNSSTQRPRRLELVEAGLVIDSGHRRPTSTGSMAICWIATPDGDEAA